jgi:hypothetical protein
VAYVAAFGALLVWGGLLTLAEARWNRNTRFLDHPRVLPADKQRAMPHMRRSYVYQGARIIGVGLVVAASVAVGTGSAAWTLAVGAATELFMAAEDMVRHQRRGPRK